MAGIALYRADQIGNEIVSLAKLRIDIGNALVHILPQPDKPVVYSDDCNQQHRDDNEENPFHGVISPLSLLRETVPSMPAHGKGKVVIERPDVDELLAGPLGQWLQQQTHVREEAREASNSRIVQAAFVVLPLSAFLFFGPSFSFELKLWIVGASLIGAGWWCYAPRAKAIKDTKHGINAALAEALGLQYQHEFEPGAGFGRAKAFKMLPHYNRANFEDLWSGELGGRMFTLHEAHLEQRRQSGKNSHYVTVFRGPVMTIGFSRQFHGTTLVERANKHRNFGLFGEKDSVDLADLTLDRVDMVHPEFEDEFSIYSTDQVEARYLVHPAYVEKLIELESAFSGKKVRTLFHDGELTILLETKNMFESGGMDASRDREMVESCIAQFMSMADLAGTLNEPAR